MNPNPFKLLFLCFGLWLAACTATENNSESLEDIFGDYWVFMLETDPYLAGGTGKTEANALLPDVGLEALENRYEEHKSFRKRLVEVDSERLSETNRISYRLLLHQLEDRIEDYELRHYFLPFNGWWDYHASFAEQPNRMPFRDVQDYENYISRLEAFPEMNRQYIERLQTGVSEGLVRPAVVLENYLPTIDALVTEAGESRFMQPFESFPRSVPDERQEEIRARGLDIIENKVMTAFRELSNFMHEVYLPAATETIGISDITGGSELYAYLVRHYTTLDITPVEVHNIGLDEVARIRGEMLELIAEIEFEGDFDAFVEFLRTDPQFYAESKTELLEFTALILKRMDGKLPGFFGRLPRMPYGLREVPDYLAPRMTTAYYNRPAQDGTRAGFYYVNTYDLPSRPLYEVEALSFHEAVPGHHLQLALQQELEGLPEFRQNSSFTVFVEGWALYSEWLALEMGFYEDPYSNFGRLTYEMWRALRLVVDTGIHAKGWSRDQAINYMAENSALSLLNIRNEVDRYIFWPGQALAYKTGEIEIRRLRGIAEERLGDDFNLRAFHDLVLENGSITLEILEEQVEAWITSH